MRLFIRDVKRTLLQHSIPDISSRHCDSYFWALLLTNSADRINEIRDLHVAQAGTGITVGFDNSLIFPHL